MGVPRIIPASQLNIFKFYRDNAVHEAVFHKGTILKLAYALPIDAREQAYKCALRLSQNYTTVLSPCGSLYRVWVDVRCPDEFKLEFRLDTDMFTSE